MLKALYLEKFPSMEGFWHLNQNLYLSYKVDVS